MEVFLNADAWIALLTLTFLEIVLGLITLSLSRLQQENYLKKAAKKATKDWNVFSPCLCVSYSIRNLLFDCYEEPWFSINFSWLSAQLSGQSIILLLGGLFLIYKAPMK
jgi:hypothetical protein